MKKITLLIAFSFSLLSYAQTELTHTPDDTITNGVLCDPAAPGDINAFYSYVLGDFGVDPTENFTISQVRFGASSLNGAPPEGLLATINVYTTDAPFPTGTLTLIETQNFAMLPGTENTLYEIPFDATVPGDSEVVLEVQFPNDGATIAAIGTNPTGNSISYVTGCNGAIPNPTNLQDFNITAAWVIEATGDTTLSIGDNVLSENISIFPNPTNGDLNINFARNFGATNIDIINVNGQKVMTASVDGIGNNTLATSKLANGVYFAQVTNETGVATVKFIKN